MVGILAANSAVSGDIEVSNSLRFNPGDSAYLYKTPSASNKKTWTISTWVKRGTIYDSGEVNADANQVVLGSAPDTSNYAHFYFTFDQLRFYDFRNGSFVFNFKSNAEHRDPSAWYHIVAACDTTQSTESDRFKMYVNGSQITSWANDVYPSQNADTLIFENNLHTIGRYGDQGGGYWNGYMTEFHAIDGAAKAPTDFGKFDDNGVWIPKKYTGSYGSEGWFFEFKETGTSANSSGMGADTSGNDNHFTPSGLTASDVTTDTCTNNFATMNSVESPRQQGGVITFKEGNCQIVTSYTDANYARYPQAYSTMAVTKGKWYFEMKPISGDVYNIGVFSPEDYASNSTTNPYGGYAATGCIYTEGGEVRQNDGSTEDLGTYGTSDIVGCALDMDNNAVYFHKNNTYINSGNPASGGSKTGAFSLPTTGPYASNTSSITHYGFTCGDEGAADVGTMSINFGNPPYVPSSIESDANGYGSFEYAPPSGYYALCTKNLAEYG